MTLIEIARIAFALLFVLGLIALAAALAEGFGAVQRGVAALREQGVI